MNAEGLSVVVDANVWVDSYCPEHPGTEVARRFLNLALEKGCTLLYPVHASKDVAYVVRREYQRAAARESGTVSEETSRAICELAWGCVRNMGEAATPIGADASDVWLADKYLKIHPDFEDNLVLAACRRVKADFLVTNDAQLIAHADVVAKTPTQMLQLLSLDW